MCHVTGNIIRKKKKERKIFTTLCCLSILIQSQNTVIQLNMILSKTLQCFSLHYFCLTCKTEIVQKGKEASLRRNVGSKGGQQSWQMGQPG